MAVKEPKMAARQAVLVSLSAAGARFGSWWLTDDPTLSDDSSGFQDRVWLGRWLAVDLGRYC
jgi:hypothetical protein